MFSILISFAFSALIAQHEEKSFLQWMRLNNQFFTGSEYHFRLGIFLANARRVREFNSVKRTFKIGLNKFSCYTPAEYNNLLGRRQSPIQPRNKIVQKEEKRDVPDSLDWREKGIVNQIKDQGQCGSCWAFGSVQASESAYALTHGTLYSLSEQNLVDCVPNCYGCDGGFESSALNYVLLNQNGCFNSEEDYPYEAEEVSCRYIASKGINKILSFETDEKPGDEDYLKTLASKGVCDIGIDASPYSFQAYSSGVYYEPDCSSEFLDHAVGLVGYGTENGVDYWIVRNSWGKNWGEDGYIRMSRNRDNNCGIATCVYQVHA